VFVVLFLAAFTMMSSEATAATARVRWLPSTDAVIRYDVYVRNAGKPHGAPAWSGKPVAAADGSLEALVPFTAAASANYFAVVAIGDGGESTLSRELSVGTPSA
jgi:hypothetical protein